MFRNSKFESIGKTWKAWAIQSFNYSNIYRSHIKYSSVVSENKQKESTQSNLTNTLTAATPTISTPESSIDFDVEKTSRVNKGKAESSERDKALSEQKKLSSYFAKK